MKVESEFKEKQSKTCLTAKFNKQETLSSHANNFHVNSDKVILHTSNYHIISKPILIILTVMTSSIVFWNCAVSGCNARTTKTKTKAVFYCRTFFSEFLTMSQAKINPIEKGFLKLKEFSKNFSPTQPRFSILKTTMNK